jgi:hypothetical protein
MAAAEHPAIAWAESGAMALSGYPDGPPLAAPGDPAGAVRCALDRVRAHGVPTPGIEVLSERAALTGRSRNAPWSVGGAFRSVATRDGWLGLSLSRPSDVQLLPALIEGAVGADPWEAVHAWARDRTSAAAEERAALIGLPAAAVPPTPQPPSRPGVVVTSRGPLRQRGARPRVIDLTALWAGPLCANLIGLAGAEVITVESRTRPDGARSGTPDFYSMLHDGHELHRLDLDDPAELRGLIATADVVLEGSRPRALQRMGIDADAVVANGTIWLSITARGRSEPMRVGFGDDVAAGAGLIAWQDGIPCPAGDAIADPLAGVHAAAAILEAMASDQACLIDVSMHDLCCEAAIADPGSPARVFNSAAGWLVEAAGRTVAVASPRRRGSLGTGQPSRPSDKT